MSTHAVDIDEIQTTRGEKFLALVLGIFIFIGLVWGYVKLDMRDGYDATPQISAEDQAAIDQHTFATGQLWAAQAAEAQALADLELKRERYRTALDAEQPAQALRAEYREAETTLADAEERVVAAQACVAQTKPAADAAFERRSEAERERFLNESRLTFVLRLGFLLSVLGAAYGLVILLRGSRYFTLALAGVGAGAVLALVFAGDYVEDYVEILDTGPVVLSAAGIGLTVGTFWALQRYLQKRLPLRRVRKHECPFCGFPVASNSRCEGCSREVIGACTQCGDERRVGVAFCGSCGKA
jgi:hypothetical protein